MNRWSPEARNRVILLTLFTAALLGILRFFLIGSLEESLQRTNQKIVLATQQLGVLRMAIEKAENYHAIIRRGGVELGNYEDHMAQGDTYRWMRNALLKLQERHNVTITAFPPPQDGQLSLPPKVPYKARTFVISGTARYHDFGAFLAALENSSPFVRLKALNLEATASGVEIAGEDDILIFRVEFLTLVKPSAL